MPITNTVTAEELAEFTGTTAYYRPMGVPPKTDQPYGGVHTDGVHFLTEHGLLWFVDYITHHHGQIAERFQVWKMSPDDEQVGATVQIEDGNQTYLHKFKLPFASIPCLNKETHLEVWCIDGVILLPSEY